MVTNNIDLVELVEQSTTRKIIYIQLDGLTCDFGLPFGDGSQIRQQRNYAANPLLIH